LNILVERCTVEYPSGEMYSNVKNYVYNNNNNNNNNRYTNF